MRLRIAYIASRWDYGDPARGLSFEETNFRSALEGMGHGVHPYDFIARHKQLGKRTMNDELLQFVADMSPDVAVFVLFKDEIDIETVRSLTASGVRTFNWFCDDHWRFDSFSRHYAPAFSLVSTTHAESVPRYHRMGCQNVVLSQWACNRYGYGRRAEHLTHDVTFVGQPYGNRRATVRRLCTAGFDVHSWGYGWKSGRLEHAEMVQVFGSSRINLNLSNAWRERLWRRRPAVGQIKARIFEIAGSGGFVLTERAPHLADYFELEHELSTFSDEDELVEKVAYWLANEEERRSVADAGYRRVMSEHTYDHRFMEIFRALELGP
ncbi:MAG: glycosyltransferase family 1 protein [Chloroflexi bacterium]|nr:glycosyltransferase family 1 protein [Chloroflexota bacterium]